MFDRRRALIPCTILALGLSVCDAQASQPTCSSPATLATLQQLVDENLVNPLNRAAQDRLDQAAAASSPQVLAAAIQAATQSVANFEELIKNVGWDQATRARYLQERTDLEKDQCIAPQPPPAAPPPDTSTYASVQAAEGTEAANAWATARAIAGANAYEKGTRPADIAQKYAYAQQNFAGCQNSHNAASKTLEQRYQARASQVLTGAQQQLLTARDRLANVTAAAQTPAAPPPTFQPISITPEDIVTTGKTEFQTTCRATLMLHHGTETPRSYGQKEYKVEQTDAGQILVTVYGLQ